MPYCGSCGAPMDAGARFCGRCGAAQQNYQPPVYVQPQPQPQPQTYYAPPPPPPPPPVMQPPMPQAQPQMQPAPQMGGEATVGVLLLRRMKSMGRWDTFAGVVTTQRLIVAQLTKEMLNAASQQALDQAKAEGKGFWGQWGDQLRSTFGYTKRYLSMPPQAILAETPGNFAIPNNSISQIDVRVWRVQGRDAHELIVHFHSSYGTYEYHIDENSDFTDLLKRVYGERVKMPFGHYFKSVNVTF